ncbi:MAG: CerR family C-terminal domain-containing protein [Limisphaerales bacterium]
MTVSINLEPLSAETRQNLLEAAGKVFAEVGFRAATVREICQRAQANIAAVNYYFGDKEKLYSEVLRFSQQRALEKYPPDFGLKSNAPAEQRLNAFVHSFLLRIFDESPVARHAKLMAREMIEPTSALDLLVAERIRPLAQQLSGIVRELLGAGASRELIRLSSMSIVSQCVFYHHCRPVVQRLFPEQKFSVRDIDLLAEHITQFSLAALNRLAKKKSVKNKSRIRTRKHVSSRS